MRIVILAIFAAFAIGAFLEAHGRRDRRPCVPVVHNRWPGV